MDSAGVHVVLLAVAALLGGHCRLARADGGTLRVSQERSSSRLSVFTSPTPLATGVIDVSVLQTAQATIPSAASAFVVIARHEESGTEVRQPATQAAATNKLFRTALCELPLPGAWHFRIVSVDEPQSPEIEFTADVQSGIPAWFDLAGWICWPAIPIGLFVMHQRLVRRSASQTLRRVRAGTRSGGLA